MISWLSQRIYRSTPATFRSSYSLSESIARLKAATVGSVFQSLAKEAAVGTVSENTVKLQRVIPMVQNSFKPFFTGRFVIEDDRVVLVGHFSMHGFVKIFLGIWFGLCLLGTVVATFAIRGENSAPWQFPLLGLGMIVAGIALVLAGQWLARNDAAWLSATIRTALGTSSQDQ